MYSDEDLGAAVQAGIFSEQAIADFRALVSRRQHTALVDEEHFRLLSGFNDIFVVIACLLLLGSVAWLGASLAVTAAALGVMLVSWGLAEFFVRRRRMALPAIVLLGSFVAGGGALAGGLFYQLETTPDNATLQAAGLGASLAAWGHWLRFRVPITVAAGTAAAIATLLAVTMLNVPELRQHADALLLAGGVLSFVLAMRWDMQDPARQQRQSDVAFWLHLLAAPLIVHPFFSTLGILHGEDGLLPTLAVLVLYLLFGLLSLAVDRRALLVSAMGYVLYAFGTLLQGYDLAGKGPALAGLLLGGVLLLLSAFWHACRSRLLPMLPMLPAALCARLPALK